MACSDSELTCETVNPFRGQVLAGTSIQVRFEVFKSEVFRVVGEDGASLFLRNVGILLCHYTAP